MNPFAPNRKQFGLIAALLVATVGASSADDLRVAAASDLTKAFTEIATAYEKQTGEHVALTFGSSGLLTKQLENGAPFDLFAAANVSYLTELRQHGLVSPTDTKIFVQGHIGMFTRKGNPKLPATISGLTDPRFLKIAIANPKVAPYGKAAQEALEAARIWTLVQDRLVTGENIQQTLQYSQTGNADVAIVSASLGKSADGQFVPIPDNLHNPILQAMGVLNSSNKIGNARKFSSFVTSATGLAILKKNSFTLPPSSPKSKAAPHNSASSNSAKRPA